ncbi:hypothetical protein [Micromonospora carbonacea]|uniref:Uncharacterized protein n=1 Tax=Micromonospora carbonacea TaxID=47853 RepID=A0A1C4WYJ4_9ACTN|nr:hypothetical protein [Micromonospora carbonacea]SCF01269.1 hypothetical protein GA0070563_104113 [Micromonospora carbonacea]
MTTPDHNAMVHWLRANGLDPDRIPQGSWAHHDPHARTISVEYLAYPPRIGEPLATYPVTVKETYTRDAADIAAATAQMRAHPPRKCSDIPDETFLAAVDHAARARGTRTANIWDVAVILAGHPHLVGTPTATADDSPGLPLPLVRAKARKLINRGTLDGCPCGCRGDFTRPAGGHP